MCGRSQKKVLSLCRLYSSSFIKCVPKTIVIFLIPLIKHHVGLSFNQQVAHRLLHDLDMLSNAWAFGPPFHDVTPTSASFFRIRWPEELLHLSDIVCAITVAGGRLTINALRLRPPCYRTACFPSVHGAGMRLYIHHASIEPRVSITKAHVWMRHSGRGVHWKPSRRDLLSGSRVYWPWHSGIMQKMSYLLVFFFQRAKGPAVVTATDRGCQGTEGILAQDNLLPGTVRSKWSPGGE